jgi:ribokinase
MTSKPVVSVVGSFAVGMTLRAPRFPVAGETLLGTDFDMGPGGKGSNQAVGAARLGAESHLIAMLGTDMFGDMAVVLYQKEGVRAEHVIRVTEHNTGVGFITLNAAGENHIVLDMGANQWFTPAHVDQAEDTITNSRVVLSVLEIPPETAKRGMQLARKHGVISLLNPAPAQPLDDALLAEVDVLTPNESELRILCGLAPDAEADTLELAHCLQGRGVRNLVVTRGAKGALLVAEDGTVEQVPGHKIDVVDTTGAGDAFNAALGVALAEGRPLPEAVRFAVAAGALACTRLGVIPALPPRAAVEALL